MRVPRTIRHTLALGLFGALVACSPGGQATGITPTPSSAGGATDYPGWLSGPVAGATIVPVIVSSQLAVGVERFLFTLYDARDLNKIVAAPDVTTELAFYDLARDPGRPAGRGPGTFIWAVEGQRGLYHASATFAEAGAWGVEVTVHRAGQPDTSARVRFDVLPQATTPALGAAVPISDTPTAGSASAIAAISTDAHPNAAFYRTSEAAAVQAHRPFVLVFATPLFCQSQICGPTLDTVKATAVPFLDRVAFIHVEPYVLKVVAAGGLQPVLDAAGHLQLVPAMQQWGLPSEPWVFVVGGDGKLSAKFEGAVGKDELAAAIQAVAR